MLRRTPSSLALVVLLLSACQPPGGGSTADGAVSFDVALQDAEAGVDATTLDDRVPDALPDAPSEAGPREAAAVPESLASRQSVRFVWSGSGAGSDGGQGPWIGTLGTFCDAMPIVRDGDAGGGQLVRDLGYQCICECPGPPQPTVVRWVRATAGTVVATWDARALTTYTVDIDCAQRGWPGAGIQHEIRGAARPVEAGRYRAQLRVADTLPSGCSETSPGEATCSPSIGFPPGGGSLGMRVCTAPRILDVTFDLPASGDLDVPVTGP